MILRSFCILVFIFSLIACENSTLTTPNRGIPRIASSCVPSGPNISCQGILYDVPNFGDTRDVTSEATWLVSDSSMGIFSSPGYFKPMKHGEVAVWMRFQQFEDEEDAHSWFLVDPGSEARRLYFMAGNVVDAMTGAGIQGAEVRILTGHSKNAHAITNQTGYYDITRILTEQQFSVKASASGYQSLTLTFQVHSPIGTSIEGPFLNFELRHN